MTASANFTALTNQALEEIWQSVPFTWQEHLSNAIYEAVDRPSSYALLATGTPSDSILLGMYEPYLTPAKITIYEDSITRAMRKFGGLYAGVKSVLAHEIFEHHFGMDHTKETMDAGMAPAFMVTSDGEDIKQWELRPPASPACIPCGQRQSGMVLR